ncbi:sensor histidine kinase [Erythrobacter sp. MTPC3]|uniref:sensor histidine kinase n=1 Tax=Erythrobacter sp. MTPC3 TaxID=3056564 RepID=UPI0036F25E06
MFFDDRLATVLRQRAASEAGARTQFRQLLDILGNRKFASQDDRSHSMVAAAWLRLQKLAEDIPARNRAEMIREAGWRFRNPDLAAHLAEQEPDVASAALNRVQLSAEEWSSLIPRLPVRARGFLRLRRDLPLDTEALLERLGVHDRGLPRPEIRDKALAAEPAIAQPDVSLVSQATQPDLSTGDTEPPRRDTPQPARAMDAADSGRSEISALVERIAQFRRTRDLTPTDTDRSPRLPLGEVTQPVERRSTAFGFSADASGRINWAESEVAPMVVGTRLVRPPVLGEADGESVLERAFSRRQPISQAAFEIEGAGDIAGRWIVDAQPSFTKDGNFSGYLGRFRRLGGGGRDANSPAAREADRIRQLLHELRTPVTAVQGYAEVIQQQLFGPAPHEYRALAAAIASDAARILAGFEELDRLAKLETGAIETEAGATDLTALAQQVTNQIGQVLRARMAGIDFDAEAAGDVPIMLHPDDAEALIWRLLATLGGLCASGEMLGAEITVEGERALLTCDLPTQLIEEDDIFAAEAKPVGNAINSGIFGAGFSLRLARAEAEAAGGHLAVSDEDVTLCLPLLTGEDALPSPDNVDQAGARA